MEPLSILIAVEPPPLKEVVARQLARFQSQWNIEPHLTSTRFHSPTNSANDLVDVLHTAVRAEVDILVHSWDDQSQVPGIYSHFFLELPALTVCSLSTDSGSICAYRQEIVRHNAQGDDNVAWLLDLVRHEAENIRLRQN